MENVKKTKIFVLQIAIFSYTYLTFCPIWFIDRKYKLIINHIPFVILLVLDVFLVFKLQKKLWDVFMRYWKSNKFLIIAIFLYVIYDIATLMWAHVPQYSLMKYFYFGRTLFLVGNIFLCLYDKDSKKMIKYTEQIIKCISIVFILAVITTIIRWHLGFTPYYYRISLIGDYNTFSRYMIFCLLFFVYYFFQTYQFHSKRKKRIYIAISVIACNLIFISGSRRATVLVSVMVVVLAVFLVIKNAIFYFNNKNAINKRWYKKCIGIQCCVLLIITLSLNFCVPAFENYTYFYRAMPSKIQAGFEKLMKATKVTGDILPKLQEGEGVYIDSGNETKLSLRYESVNPTEGLSTRRDIWAVAIEAINNFQGKEILFGGGNGYAWEIYDNMHNPGVQKLLELYQRESPQLHWMHPHNLFFTEFLEGGLIKLVNLLFLAVMMIVYLIKYIMKNEIYGMLFLSLYLLFAGNFLMGSTYGLPGEDLFWLTLGIFIVVNSIDIPLNNYYNMLKSQTEGKLNE